MSSIKVNSISSFTGTQIAVTGSLVVNGSLVATASSTVSSASFAVSSSRAQNATSASFATNAVSASFVSSASFATNAVSASYLNPITNSYIILTQVSQSLNFANDDAAAAGGVPLGGLYRSGSFVLIRVGGTSSSANYLSTENNNQLITENGNFIILNQ